MYIGGCKRSGSTTDDYQFEEIPSPASPVIGNKVRKRLLEMTA